MNGTATDILYISNIIIVLWISQRSYNNLVKFKTMSSLKIPSYVPAKSFAKFSYYGNVF